MNLLQTSTTKQHHITNSKQKTDGSFYFCHTSSACPTSDTKDKWIVRFVQSNVGRFKTRKYDKAYLALGFTSTMVVNEEKP